MSQRSYVTAHVLDAATGTPASGVSVTLSTADGATLAHARTDEDGRVNSLGPEALASGTYRITFGTGEYFAALEQATFYPQVQVEFLVDEAQAHYHVPLLLSPFAYSTYRGS